MLRLRDASPDDAERLLRIYAPYVTETAVSFEYQVPSAEEFADRIRRFQRAFPYLVAEWDGVVVGYAYAHPFHEREAYRYSVETTVYLDRAFRRRGIGRQLYAELERRLTALGIRNLYACVALPREENDPHLTCDSLRFHEAVGYTVCGHLNACGFKFGRWYDMLYLEKRTAPEKSDQP